MSARLIVFPATARRRDVRRIAAKMASLPPDQAQRHLVEHLRKMISRWRAIGVDHSSIERQLIAFEAAANAECWSLAREDTA